MTNFSGKNLNVAGDGPKGGGMDSRRNALDQVIPEGYKQTEVGIIPAEWNAAPAKEVVEFFGGYGFSSRLASSDGIKWLKIANVGINEVKWDALSYLPEYLVKSFKEYSLAENDVVMALTRPLLGDQLKVTKIESKDLPALLNQRVAKLKPKNSNKLNYIYYSIQREDFIAAMNLAMAGTDPPNIGTSALGKIFVAIPEDEEEQTVIANALSDVDALLTELEKLISKKQAIKTAAMQQLLTGKTRLPQFATYAEGEKQGQPKGTKPSELGEIPEDWDALSIEECSIKVGSGKTPTGGSSVYVDSGRPFVRSQNVGWGELRLTDLSFISEETHNTFKGSEIKLHDVLLNITGASIGRCALASEKVVNGNVNQHVCIIRVINQKAHPYVLQTLINSDSGQNQIDSYQAGGNREGLNFSQVKSMKFPFSNNLEEQKAIATILSDMDNEIQILEHRLAKTRQIKQGMMQELLTGRTRLPFDKN